MSSEGLSQEEIDALLAGGIPSAEDADPAPEAAAPEAAAVEDPAPEAGVPEAVEGDAPVADADAGGGIEEPVPAAPAGASEEVDQSLLSAEERDALGEIGNITMASAATALNALLNQPVQITTPRVSLTTEHEVQAGLDRPAVSITVGYTAGLDGQNVFVLARRDCAVIVDLMMGGDGSNASDELDDLQISGVSEAMNQMMGSAATSLASIVGRKVDISTPEVVMFDHESVMSLGMSDGPLVRVAFDLAIGSLLETEIMQLLPLEFARELVGTLLGSASAAAPAAAPEPAPAPMGMDPAAMPPAEAMAAATMAPPVIDMPMGGGYAPPPPGPGYADPAYGMPPGYDPNRHLHAVPQGPPPTVQPAAFPTLDRGGQPGYHGDIGLLLDVPLQVTVELGRTQLRIRNVLELAPGSIIELEKLSGEPVDVLVNGRQIARGEVVVIDEEFGVRITDIASRAARLRDVAEG